MWQGASNHDRHPEARAAQALACARASKGDGPGAAAHRGRILRGTRSARAPQDDGVRVCWQFFRITECYEQ